MKKIGINGVAINYRDEGTGEAIIFLHAFALDQRMWDQQIEFFSKSHRVIALDWRGFGRSEDHSEKITMEALADDLATFIKALRLQKFTLCGLSMGGYVVFAFLKNYPELFAQNIEALILADTKATIENEAGKRSRIEMAEKALEKGSAEIAELVLPKWLSARALEFDPHIIEIVRKMISENGKTAIAAAQYGMSERTDATELLSKIACPTLIIVGTDDSLTPPEESEKMAKSISSAILVEIEGAGHLSNLEKSKEFNLAIHSFLQK